jgi:hypothetical protein
MGLLEMLVCADVSGAAVLRPARSTVRNLETRNGCRRYGPANMEAMHAKREGNLGGCGIGTRSWPKLRQQSLRAKLSGQRNVFMNFDPTPSSSRRC